MRGPSIFAKWQAEIQHRRWQKKNAESLELQNIQHRLELAEARLKLAELEAKEAALLKSAASDDLRRNNIETAQGKREGDPLNTKEQWADYKAAG